VSNDKNNIMNDDEYKFPQDEYLHQSSSATADPGEKSDEISDEKIVENKSVLRDTLNRIPFLKNKKFYFILAFLVVIFIGIHMMHSGNKATKVVAHKPVVQQPVAHKVQTAVSVQHPNPQLLNQLDSIKSSQVSNQDTLSSLQNNISGLKSQLNEASSDNSQLAQAVTTLTAQVKILAGQVSKNTAKLTVKPKKVAGHKVYRPKPITYDINAVVPGRAWITSSNGHAYSVAVGDQIAQYGRVRAIDENTGRIYTTSGKIIGYGPNDS
jgi:intracellular multiplication protein IcmG